MMRNIYLIAALLLFMPLIYGQRTIYVATSGNDGNAGTMEHPYQTINKAVDVVQPGDTIYVRGGTYMLASTIRVKAKQNARSDARIYLWGYPGERVVIDGSQIVYSGESQFKMSRCIYHNHEANYWHYKNLELCNARDNGMKLEGSYNIVENCKFYGNNDTGLQIGMFKDFAIEETKSFPISGSPEFNPGYSYCKYNTIINCDAWYNYDAVTYNGSADDGGDADGFAAKLFPGPGTEFHGCRAWNNSDDNWDLYMVYHPIVINNCWSYKAGYDKNNIAKGNGNGFKLGGGGSAGGAAFDQSVGAHVVIRCVAFGSAAKGFDQNNAYEAMYLFNNLAWNNAFNYRFPSAFQYGTMYMRNNIGFKAGTLNHEFLSVDKPGFQIPNTSFNSWTTLDGCDPIKEGNKVNGVSVKTKDYSSEFLSLSVADFMADREPDGSLPRNNFARIKPGSVFIDKGEAITDFAPVKHWQDGISAANVTIPFIGATADFGAYEVGDPVFAKITVKGSKSQRVYNGTSIEPIVLLYDGEGVTGLVVDNLPLGLNATANDVLKQVVISGSPVAEGTYTVSTVGGTTVASISGTITIATQLPAELTATPNTNQSVESGKYIAHMVFAWGGGATSAQVSELPEGLSATVNANNKTVIIHGVPQTDGSFTVNSVGGDGLVTINASVVVAAPRQVLANWYNFQDAALPNYISSFLSYAPSSTLLTPAYAGDGSLSLGVCSTGALQLPKGTGTLTVACPNGLESLKIRFYITGGRQLTVKYGETGSENTWTSGGTTSISKGSFEYDLVSMVPALQTKLPIVVNIINSRTDGGNLNIHDLFAATYADVIPENEDPMGTPVEVPVPTSVANSTANRLSVYSTANTLVVEGDVVVLDVFSMEGRLLKSQANSRVVDVASIRPGVYVLRIKLPNGTVQSHKWMKR
jgi:hypothetical protein